MADRRIREPGERHAEERREPCLPFARLLFKTTGHLLMTSKSQGLLGYAHLYRSPPSMPWKKELWLSWRAGR